jgi:choice-of-anchor A domain-containing protein
VLQKECDLALNYPHLIKENTSQFFGNILPQSRIMKTYHTIFQNRKFGKNSVTSYFRFFQLVLLLAAPALAFSQKLTDPALNFTLFIKDDLILKGTEVEGRVAVGGNLIMAGGTYQIAPRQKDDASAYRIQGLAIGLAVRGGVVFSNGGDLKVNNKNYVKIGNPNSPNALKASYNGGDFRIRYANGQGGMISINTNPGEFSNPPVSETNNPVFENVFGQGGGQIDIDGAFADFEATSRGLKDLAHTVVMRDFDNASIEKTGPFLSRSGLPNKPKFILDPQKINVLTISNEVWSSFQNEVRFEGFSQNKGFALIINILDASGDVRFANAPDLNNNKGHVVFNFPDATSDIRLVGNGQIDGVILAPKAKVTKQTPANLVGQVIARSFEHDGHEIHYEPLRPEWVEESINVRVATYCLLDAPYLDYEVEANFETNGMLASIEWLTPDGEVVRKLTNQPLQGRLLFPGAAVNQNGEGIAWPGWKVINGRWEQVEDENAKLKLQGAKIRVTVNPVFLADISYPQSTDDCFTYPPPTDTPPLPVRLVSFNVNGGEQNSVALKWTIADAENFSHFEVERSNNGRAFTKAAVVDFTGEKIHYQFVDGNPYSNMSYYRLKMVDLDGTFAYSHVESVRTAVSGEGKVYGYPNPFFEKISIVSTAKQAATVYDATGRVVSKLILDKGVNEINAGSWPTGLNLIRTEDGRTVKAIKN